jgi:hypothetical protein
VDLKTYSGANSATYSYNAYNQRVFKDSSLGVYYYLYDQAGHLVAESNKNSILVTNWRDYRDLFPNDINSGQLN